MEIRIRPVGNDELELFVEAAGLPDHQREIRQYLKNMFAAGSMRPEWCFLAEEGDRPVGRVAFWTLPGMEEPFALVLLDVDWEGDYAAVATRLLEGMLDEARALGAEEIEHVVDDPPIRPQFQHHAERRIELLESVGFSLRRETSRFERRETEASRPARTIDVSHTGGGRRGPVRRSDGESLRRHAGPRDPRGGERLGAKRAAREFFEDAQRVSTTPHGGDWLTRRTANWRASSCPPRHLAS